MQWSPRLETAENVSLKRRVAGPGRERLEGASLERARQKGLLMEYEWPPHFLPHWLAQLRGVNYSAATATPVAGLLLTAEAASAGLSDREAHTEWHPGTHTRVHWQEVGRAAPRTDSL